MSALAKWLWTNLHAPQPKTAQITVTGPGTVTVTGTLAKSGKSIEVDLASAFTPAPPPPQPPTPTPLPPYPTVWATPGRATLSDADATALVIPVGEVRPANTAALARVPTDAELADYRAKASTGFLNYRPEIIPTVTGRPARTLTTGEAIAWAALKHGIPPVVLMAQIAQESWWRQSTVGDSGASVSIAQIKVTPANYHPGTQTLAPASVCFALDYLAAVTFHYYYSGPVDTSWVKQWQQGTPTNGWDSLGRWFEPDDATQSASYVAAVKGYVASQPWTKAGF